MAQKFVVFASALDLKAHMVERHGESMSSKDLKAARRTLRLKNSVVDEGGDMHEIEKSLNARERERERNRADAQAPAESTAQARRRQAFSGLLSTGNEIGGGTSIPTQQPSNTPFLDREDLDPLTQE